MGRFVELFKGMLGAAPRKPEKVSETVQQIMVLKYADKDRYIKEKLHARAHHDVSHRWRNRRWAVLIAVNLLFVFSFWLDIQILEGALTASRFVGFHLIDLNSALHVMLAHKHIIVNLVIGTGTVLVLWLLLGGRTFCSWVCPYHLLAEWAESIHLWLVKKKLVTDQAIDRRLRTGSWLVFAALALATALGHSRPPTTAELASVWPQLVFIVFCVSVFGILFWNMGVAKLGPLSAGLFANFTPVITYLIAIAQGRRPDTIELAGALIVLAALIANNRHQGAKARRVGMA